MKASSETIAELLAYSDYVGKPKVRPRVRPAIIQTLKQLIARAFAG